MDPNANLAEQERILAAGAAHATAQRARLHELRQALNNWIGHDGFAPDWSRCPRAAKYYGEPLPRS